MTAADLHRLDVAELAAVPMFAHVQRERLGELAATRAVRRFDAGSVLFARGDPATRLLVVLEGDVSALVDHRNGARSAIR